MIHGNINLKLKIKKNSVTQCQSFIISGFICSHQCFYVTEVHFCSFHSLIGKTNVRSNQVLNLIRTCFSIFAYENVCIIKARLMIQADSQRGVGLKLERTLEANLPSSPVLMFI